MREYTISIWILFISMIALAVLSIDSRKVGYDTSDWGPMDQTTSTGAPINQLPGTTDGITAIATEF